MRTDYQAGADWLRDKPGRIAAFQDPSEHVFATLPIFTGQPVYGWIRAAHTYRFFFEGRRNASWLPALGVKWVMSLAWRAAPKGAELRKAFGRIGSTSWKGSRRIRSLLGMAIADSIGPVCG